MRAAPFKLNRGQVASGAMPADRDVEHLDVIEYVSVCFVPGWVDQSLDSLLLQRVEEALDHCNVVTVSSPAYARNDAVLLQQ